MEMVCGFLCGGMTGSGVDRVVFDLLQDLVSNVHGPEPVNFRYLGWCICQDGLAELFQLQPDGIDLGNRGVGKGYSLLTIWGFNIESENVLVLGGFQLDDL